MGDDPINNLDRRILHLLQVDARGASDTAIAEETDVTGTTVNNRIRKLEEQGIIRGYHPDIDYEQAGYPLTVLFICSVDLSDRPEVAEEILEVRGVVNVREMMAGEENLHVAVVAQSTADVKETTQQLNDLGVRIMSSNLLAKETAQPWNHFHQDVPDEDIETDVEIESTEE